MYIKSLFPVITSGLVGTISLNVALTTIEKENVPKNKVYYNSLINQSLEKLYNAYNQIRSHIKNNPKRYPDQIHYQFMIFYREAFFITTKIAPFNVSSGSKLIIEKIFKLLNGIQRLLQRGSVDGQAHPEFGHVAYQYFNSHIKVIYESIWKLGFEGTATIIE